MDFFLNCFDSLLSLGWRAIPWWYGLVSLLTFLEYGRDKLAAKCGWWRTPEKTLHFLELLGGWPGAWIGQFVFHHKCRKRKFLLAFGLAVFLNLVIFGCWFYWFWCVCGKDLAIQYMKNHHWL